MTWVAVCRRTDIPDGRGWPVRVGGHSIALFEGSGGVRAVANTCRHVGNPIDDGPVQGETVTCPWHGWRYDLLTGDHLTVFGPRPGLRTYPVQVTDGTVEVWVDEPVPGS